MRLRVSLFFLLLIVPSVRAAAPPDKPVHWAFRPPVCVEPPKVNDPSWVRTPVDSFVLAGLDKASLKPAPPAGRAALLRRITYDLTGLPPTPQELDDFLADKSAGAYEKVVDRLLASPHFGERWAQHWLDVARFAESNGYEVNADRPDAWRYRDYVVRAFNDDKPFDRFVAEQVAGDLLAKDAVRQGISGPDRPEAEPLIAAGFNRCGPVHQVSGNIDADVSRQEVLTEMTNGVGSAFLGLTVGCARCHDHKFDPISQADYYRLQAFFGAAQPQEVDLAGAEARADYDRRLKEFNEKTAPLRQKLADLESPYRARLREAKKAKLEAPYRDALAVEAPKRTPEQKKLVEHAEILLKIEWDEIVDALSPEDRAARADLRNQLHDLEARKPPPPARAWTLAENGDPFAHILKRGDPKKKGDRVAPDFPKCLIPGDPPAAPADRTDLARWLVGKDNPLTARVIVNRLWQHHFGRGLVATPNDFGARGEPPTHPELLDWLAVELVEHHWSLKHLHRIMVLSNAYQQESRPADGPGQKADPDNRFLWRMNRRRLDGEALRDAVLAVAGTLNPAAGGPSVRVPLEPDVYALIFTEGEPDGLWPVTPDAREHTRRSLYLFAKRNLRLPLFEVFDQPDTLSSCPVRPVSTFAPQALILLNGPFMQEQSRALAVRLLREAGPDAPAQVTRAYRLALARPPKDGELRAALDFLDAQAKLLRDRLRARLRVGVPAGAPDDADPAAAAALADFCLALLNRNEFLYVP
jgi:hypothetical protein